MVGIAIIIAFRRDTCIECLIYQEVGLRTTNKGERKMNIYLFAFLAMVFWGLAPVFGKIGLTKVSPLIGLYVRTFVVAAILLVYGVLSGQIKNLTYVGRTDILYLAGEAVFASLLGHLAYFFALKSGAASRVVPFIAAYPLVTFLVGVSFLGEKLTLMKGAGAGLVVLGLLFLMR